MTHLWIKQNSWNGEEAQGEDGAGGGSGGKLRDCRDLSAICYLVVGPSGESLPNNRQIQLSECLSSVGGVCAAFHYPS